jgi:hypothetical protein
LDPPLADVLVSTREREEASTRWWRETERRERGCSGNRERGAAR